MDILDLREYALSLYDVEESTPFDDVTLVYKVGGKMFAVANLEDFTYVVIHHSPEVGEALRDKYEQINPAWHFNKRFWSSVSPAAHLRRGDLSMLRLRRPGASAGGHLRKPPLYL